MLQTANIQTCLCLKILKYSTTLNNNNYTYLILVSMQCACNVHTSSSDNTTSLEITYLKSLEIKYVL